MNDMKTREPIRAALTPATTKELGDGRFVAVSAAAAKLKVTPATVLNRIKRGNYDARTFQGRLVLVDVSEMHATGTFTKH